MLVDGAIDRVRVEVLAQRLGVTRGSFYWHFRDRDDLLRAVLQAWRELTTDSLTQRLEGASHDPRTQLRDLMSLPQRGSAARRLARIELAIREWARRDDMARLAVEAADASRMGYIAQVYTALGWGIAQARARAFLLYAYNQGQALIPEPGAAAQRGERLQAIEDLLIQAPPATGAG